MTITFDIAPQIKTVLFDLDGTLADTAPDLAYALNQVREEYELRPMSYDTIRPVVSYGANALIYLAFEVGPEDPGFSRIKERLLSIYRENLARETRLFPGMEDVLRELESRGLRWGVVTNKPAWLTDPLMSALDLEQRAACIVSGDTTPNSKPHPEPILYACKSVGSEAAECVYVGDARRDIEAGQNAGMSTLAALFGYISDHDKPLSWGADALLKKPADILVWLDKVDPN